MARREVPEPWASAMIDKGLVYAKRPSIRALAAAAGVPSAETVRQVIIGKSVPGADTINAIADALGRSRREVAAWAGQAREAERPWTVPPDMDLLTPDEQEAITALIETIARPRRAAQRADIQYFESLIDYLQTHEPDRRDEVSALKMLVRAATDGMASGREAPGEVIPLARPDRPDNPRTLAARKRPNRKVSDQ